MGIRAIVTIAAAASLGLGALAVLAQSQAGQPADTTRGRLQVDMLSPSIYLTLSICA